MHRWDIFTFFLFLLESNLYIFINAKQKKKEEEKKTSLGCCHCKQKSDETDLKLSVVWIKTWV